MLNLSEIMLRHHDLETFEQLKQAVQEEAQTSGELFFRIDVKPPYPDTPNNWEDALEGAFSGVHSVTR
jgi:hypothetical protein